METNNYSVEFIDVDTLVYTDFTTHEYDGEKYHIEAEIHFDEDPNKVLFFDVYEDEDGEFTHTEFEIDLTPQEKQQIKDIMMDYLDPDKN